MQRTLEPEWLDELDADDPQAMASRRDLRRVNAWMGNVRTMTRMLRWAFPDRPPRRIVELGAGDGTFAVRLARRMSPTWKPVSVTLVDRQSIAAPRVLDELLKLGWLLEFVQADMHDWLSQPDLPRCDAILANLVLHHFPSPQLETLFHRCANHCQAFLAIEPRRSPLTLAASRSIGLLGCNAVSRHDGPISVRAGFACRELSGLWPADGRWSLLDKPAHLITHIFAARRLD